MSRKYILAAIAPIPISPADLQKSNLWPQTLLNNFEGKSTRSTVAASFQSNLVFGTATLMCLGSTIPRGPQRLSSLPKRANILGPGITFPRPFAVCE